MASVKAAPRRRMSAGARREQVLDVAGAIVVEDGFQAVSIQAVARRAGVTRPIVYEHFGNLQGLLEAVVDREMARALQQVSATALPDLSSGDAVELMLASLRRYLAAVAAFPATWRLVLSPPQGAPASLRRHIVRGRERVLKGMTEAVRPGSLSRELSQDPELTARLLSAMADEYARLLLSDPAQFPPGRLLEHARQVLEHMASR